MRTAAKELGIRLFGDMPIFVAYDSADVWAHPELFLLDEDSKPTVVTGVPPDYFSATGQRWGNPHYNWALMQATSFAWWRGACVIILIALIWCGLIIFGAWKRLGLFS